MLNNNKKILAIDFGTSKIGLAISDELSITANSMDKISNDHNLFENLKSIIEQNNVGEILVGMPSKGSDAIKDFITELSKKSPIKITTTNEDFTTQEAKTILSHKTKRKSRYAISKQINDNDSLSAKIFLQNYLQNPL